MNGGLGVRVPSHDARRAASVPHVGIPSHARAVRGRRDGDRHQRGSRQPDAVGDRCRILHAPIQEVAGEAEYDFLVSGIPLNNFPVPLVEEIFASYRRLLKPRGILSYFEYAGIRDLKRRIVRESERQRLTDLDRFLKGQIRAHQVAEDFVLLNVPPAIARHLRFA